MIDEYINKVTCGECSEVMSRFPSECISLTCTSPPYDDLRSYQGYTFDFEAIAQQLWRVTKPGGVVVWVVGDATVNGSESGTSFRQALRFKEIGFNLHDTMIYYINGTGAKGSNLAYWQSFEYMFVFSKGVPNVVNRIADKKNPNFGKKRSSTTGKKCKSINTRTEREGVFAPEYSIRENVWKYTVGHNDKTDHPAPFPEQLAADHIRSWSNEGDIVLDPMCGSGTTLKAARILGRRYVGIEISPEYCKIINERLSQQTLF